MPVYTPDPYRELFMGGAAYASAAAGATQCMYHAGNIVLAGAGSAFASFYLDPSFHGFTVVRLEARVACNAVAPTNTFTFNLAPVATWGGASGARATIASVSAATIAVPIAAPSASTATRAVSADTVAPAAGWFVLTCVTTAPNAANSLIEAQARLSVR